MGWGAVSRAFVGEPLEDLQEGNEEQQEEPDQSLLLPGGVENISQRQSLDSSSEEGGEAVQPVNGEWNQIFASDANNSASASGKGSIAETLRQYDEDGSPSSTVAARLSERRNFPVEARTARLSHIEAVPSPSSSRRNRLTDGDRRQSETSSSFSNILKDRDRRSSYETSYNFSNILKDRDRRFSVETLGLSETHRHDEPNGRRASEVGSLSTTVVPWLSHVMEVKQRGARK
eukprot:1175563-Prorocentrum_minimum.AAC.1